MIRGGQHSSRIATRARVLLKIDASRKAPQVASVLDVAEGKAYRVKRRYPEEGLQGVLHDRVQANPFRKLDDKAEAHLIAPACSDAPEGHQRWTPQLLANQMVESGLVDSLTYEMRENPCPHNRDDCDG